MAIDKIVKVFRKRIDPPIEIPTDVEPPQEAPPEMNP